MQGSKNHTDLLRWMCLSHHSVNIIFIRLTVIFFTFFYLVKKFSLHANISYKVKTMCLRAWNLY